jgi:hypothetical protein
MVNLVGYALGYVGTKASYWWFLSVWGKRNDAAQRQKQLDWERAHPEIIARRAAEREKDEEEKAAWRERFTEEMKQTFFLYPSVKIHPAALQQIVDIVREKEPDSIVYHVPGKPAYVYVVFKKERLALHFPRETAPRMPQQPYVIFQELRSGPVSQRPPGGMQEWSDEKRRGVEVWPDEQVEAAINTDTATHKPVQVVNPGRVSSNRVNPTVSQILGPAFTLPRSGQVNG